MSEQKKLYGKRPFWQWVVIYLVLAVIVYGAIYFLFLHKSYSTNSQNSGQQTQQSAY